MNRSRRQWKHCELMLEDVLETLGEAREYAERAYGLDPIVRTKSHLLAVREVQAMIEDLCRDLREHTKNRP